LGHAAGELVRPGFFESGKAHDVDVFPDGPGLGFGGLRGVFQRQGDVLFEREPRQQAMILKDDGS
jgi:hypothetical protein